MVKVAVAAAAVLLAGAQEADQAPPELRDFMNKLEPEVTELYHYAYAIGACEAFANRDNVLRFLDEFVAVDFQSTNLPLMMTANFAARGYVDGRQEGAQLGLDAVQCERAVLSAEEKYRAAVEASELH
jgi:hypothetical protein